jgi:hypothetical protein
MSRCCAPCALHLAILATFFSREVRKRLNRALIRFYEVYFALGIECCRRLRYYRYACTPKVDRKRSYCFAAHSNNGGVRVQSAIDISDVKVGRLLSAQSFKHHVGTRICASLVASHCQFRRIILIAFFVGVLSSLAASYAWSKIQPESNPSVINQKPEVKNVH